MRIKTSLFDEINWILIALDTEGRFISLNPAAERLFARSADDLIDQPFHSVLDESSFARAGQMLALTLQNGSVRDWELDHSQPGGEPVLVGYTTCLLRDENQQILGIGALGNDLSAKLELTARLAASNQKLEDALLQLEKAQAELRTNQAQLLHSEKMRALGQMVAGVAHEINNPLAFARNNFIYLREKLPVLQRLLAQATPQTGAGDLWTDMQDAILEGLEGIDRIRDIVLSLRNFSRPDEAGLKETDLNEGLRSTIRLLRPFCAQAIQIVESYGTIPTISSHPGEMNQVFLNLLTNSIQSIEGPGRIGVETGSEGGMIRIRITDSGKGMDERTLTRLGEPFFTTKPAGSGVGLGLAVSFGILQRHQGKIHFESKPGAGTTVTVELPSP